MTEIIRSGDILRINGTILERPEQFAQVVAEYADRVHLIAPATAAPMLPAGCVIACSILPINPDTSFGEVYPTGGGKVGLHKVSIDRIGAALGVSWDDMATRRVDDRSHPYFCEYRVVGAYRAFDGSWVQIMDDKISDLRDGSAQVDQIRRQAKDGKDWSATLEQMRARINELTITKARLRAMRTVGIKTSYWPNELEDKPFLVCKLSFVGRSDDPEIRRMFAMMGAFNMMQGPRAMFAQQPVMTPAMLMPPIVDHGSGRRPPTMPTSMLDDDDAEDRPPPGRPAAQAQAPRPAPAPAQSSREPAHGAPSDSRAGSGPAPGGKPLCRFGRLKGTSLEELDKSEMEWYRDTLRKNIDDPEKAKWAEDNKAHMQEVAAEIKRRQNVAASRRAEGALPTTPADPTPAAPAASPSTPSAPADPSPPLAAPPDPDPSASAAPSPATPPAARQPGDDTEDE